jgi:virginiamycin A acetyltransferase
MIVLLLKRILLLLGLVGSAPLILAARLETLLFGRRCERAFIAGKEILSVCPTFVGEFLRLAFYWATCRKVSPNACFTLGSMVAHREVVIGPRVLVGPYTFIGYAEIGADVLLGARVSIISGKYQHGRPKARAAGSPGAGWDERIVIGRNSWIGQDAVLLANVGENCTIGAGAVLYHDAPDNSTFLGNPARKVSLDRPAEP